MDLYEREENMANQVVAVTVTETETGITWAFDALEVELNAGDTLSWEFQGVPSDCVGGILFDSNAGFGPFQALELKGNLVTGRGNNGQTGTYPYHAQLLDANGIRSTSTQAVSVLNQLSEPDTSPVIVIACTFTSGSPGQVSIANIDPLRLFVGDTALWYVTGLPSDFFVDFLFTDPSNNSAIEPFQSLLFTRGQGEGSPVLKVVGAGFSPGELSSMTYSVQVRNFTGEVIPPVDDPQIDNLGQPPG
jgi:hypothetical protein